MMGINMEQPDFTVFADRTQIPVFRVAATFSDDRIEEDGNCYGIAVVDSDEPVTVEIRCERSLSAAKILPENRIADAEICADCIRLRLTQHGTYVIEPQGYKDTPLVLFFNPAEKNTFAPDTPGIHYYGPGFHSPGRIELGSDETLYLASGAVVDACIFAQGENITVCGHGILTQRSLPRKTVRHSLDFYKCRHVVLRDFITTDPCFWNVVLRDCSDVMIDNVKICGGRMLNDDGLDICNSTDVTVRNCFIRAQDDIIAVKGLMEQLDLFQRDPDAIAACFAPDSRGVRDLLVENCVFWCDIANVFRIGYECIAEAMEHITVRNCDIVHVSDFYRKNEEYWTNTVWYLQASHRMPIRDLLFEDLRICIDVPDLVLMKIVSMECPPWSNFGSIRNCTFRNIVVSGAGDMFRGDIFIAGNDPEHTVENIRLENVTINGKKIEHDSGNVFIGSFTNNITFF